MICRCFAAALVIGVVSQTTQGVEQRGASSPRRSNQDFRTSFSRRMGSESCNGRDASDTNQGSFNLYHSA